MKIQIEIVNRYDADGHRLLVNDVAKDYTLQVGAIPDFDGATEYLFFQNLFYEYYKQKEGRPTKFFPSFSVEAYLEHHGALNKTDLERIVNRQLDHYATANGIVGGNHVQDIKSICQQLLSEQSQQPQTFVSILTSSEKFVFSDRRFSGHHFTGSAKDAGIFLAKLLFYQHVTITEQAEIAKLFFDYCQPKGKITTILKDFSKALTALKTSENQYNSIFSHLKR